jgi:hypothetical protein
MADEIANPEIVMTAGRPEPPIIAGLVTNSGAVPGDLHE